MDGKSIINSDPVGWAAIHLSLITAAHAVANGSTDLVEIAKGALKCVLEAGYTSNPDEEKTRFTGDEITKAQTKLYAVNELPNWHFPDNVITVGWLIECGGPAMGRKPATAAFELEPVEHYVGGTRKRYNKGTYGHGGEGFPESREYLAQECPHPPSYQR